MNVARAVSGPWRALYRAGSLELARREARRGRPLDYVRLQWPQRTTAGETAALVGGDLLLDLFQRDIIESAFQPEITELFIKGCTKPGKGFAVATVANVWFDVFAESRVVITSDRIDHARDVMFAEIVTLRRQMHAPGPGQIRVNSIYDTPKHYMTIANPRTGEGFSGQHGPRTLFLFDEASAVPDEFYDNARKQARLIIAVSNPRTLSGWFRRAFPPADPDKTVTVQTSFGKRRCFTVGGRDCTNVRLERLEKPVGPPGGVTIRGTRFNEGCTIPPELFEQVKLIIPNQLDYARYRDIMSHPDPRHRAVFGDGCFPREDAQWQIILGSWLERHHRAWRGCGSEIPVEAFGLDVAASAHGDLTVLAAGGQHGLRALHTSQRSDTMRTVAWLLASARDLYGIDLTDGSVPVAVDMDGLGKGVGDRLAEQGVDVLEIRGNRPANVDPDRYANKRAELYGELARRLDPEGPWSDQPWPLPPDPRLGEELVAPEKVYQSDGIRFRLTPKDRVPGSTFAGDTLREKLGRSPDRADAVVYLFAAVRHGDFAGPATLDRPLLLVTPDEEAQLSAEENAASRPEKPFDGLLQRILAETEEPDDRDYEKSLRATFEFIGTPRGRRVPRMEQKMTTAARCSADRLLPENLNPDTFLHSANRTRGVSGRFVAKIAGADGLGISGLLTSRTVRALCRL